MNENFQSGVLIRADHGPLNTVVMPRDSDEISSREHSSAVS